MRVTRRGWGAVAVIAFSLIMAAQYGSRSLNGLVAPLVIVLAGALFTTYRAKKPHVTRAPVEPGFIGERRTVEFDVDVASPTSAFVRDHVGSGLSADGNVAETTLEDGRRLSYELELEQRGKHDLGPLSITVGDVFGLTARHFEYRQRGSVVVYPRIYDLRGGAKHDLQLLADAVREYDREEFDHLREYERGDSLRDIHWKSAAKRTAGELVVKEFVADGSAGSASIVGEATAGREDEMTAAVASIAMYLLELDVSVGVSVVNGSRQPDSGQHHRHDLLGLLAVTDAGAVGDRERSRADIVVDADATGVAIVVDGHEIPFERLVGRRIDADDRGSVDTVSPLSQSEVVA